MKLVEHVYKFEEQCWFPSTESPTHYKWSAEAADQSKIKQDKAWLTYSSYRQKQERHELLPSKIWWDNTRLTHLILFPPMISLWSWHRCMWCVLHATIFLGWFMLILSISHTQIYMWCTFASTDHCESCWSRGHWNARAGVKPVQTRWERKTHQNPQKRIEISRNP